jgi:hypothetical protein
LSMDLLSELDGLTGTFAAKRYVAEAIARAGEAINPLTYSTRGDDAVIGSPARPAADSAGTSASASPPLPIHSILEWNAAMARIAERDDEVVQSRSHDSTVHEDAELTIPDGGRSFGSAACATRKRKPKKNHPPKSVRDARKVDTSAVSP